nr:uncharacterized protein LOC105491900 [Macaca nemestrina]
MESSCSLGRSGPRPGPRPRPGPGPGPRLRPSERRVLSPKGEAGLASWARGHRPGRGLCAGPWNPRRLPVPLPRGDPAAPLRLRHPVLTRRELASASCWSHASRAVDSRAPPAGVTPLRHHLRVLSNCLGIWGFVNEAHGTREHIQAEGTRRTTTPAPPALHLRSLRNVLGAQKPGRSTVVDPRQGSARAEGCAQDRAGNAGNHLRLKE